MFLCVLFYNVFVFFFLIFKNRVLPPQQIGMIRRTIQFRSGDRLAHPIKSLPHTRLRGTSVTGLRANPVLWPLPLGEALGLRTGASSSRRREEEQKLAT